MATRSPDGISYAYLRPDPGHDPEAAHSCGSGNVAMTFGYFPYVLADDSMVYVYAHASRWNPSHILVSWQDDGHHSHWAWIPGGNVRRVNDSEQYRRCPEHLRGIRWGSRLPGFLPS